MRSVSPDVLTVCVCGVGFQLSGRRCSPRCCTGLLNSGGGCGRAISRQDAAPGDQITLVVFSQGRRQSPVARCNVTLNLAESNALGCIRH